MSDLQGDYWIGTQDTQKKQPRSKPPLLAVHTIHGIEPLDPQDTAWPPKTVPDAIQPALFGQSAKSALHTYAILDAAKIADLPQLLEASGLAHRCLFQGAALENLGDVAPWVVQLDIDATFTKNLFTRSDATFHWWDTEPGIYLRSDASLVDLCIHFRRFTKVQDDQGKWMFFRFWEPATAQIYFAGVQSDATRIKPFFGLPKQQRLELVALNRTGHAQHMIGPIIDDGPIRPQMPTFDQSDRQLLEEVSYHGLAAEINDWLQIEYPDRFSGVAPQPAADHIVDTGRRLGLTLKEEFAFLGQMMATSGAWFVHNDYPADLRMMLQGDPATRLKTLVDKYATLQRQTPQAEIMEQWADVHTHLAEIPLIDCITHQQFQTFCKRFLTNTAANIAPAIAGTRNRLSAVNLVNQREEGKAMILTLIYGPRFFEDPFYPWAQLPTEEAIEAAWEISVG